jgi:chromate reductase, NAD(P)H dehydrogenase (quinone)
VKTIALFVLFAFPLLAQMNVLVFAGSTREGSYNKLLSKEAAQIAQRLGANVTWIDLKDYPMPFYDADLEAKGMPKNAKKLRDLMVANDMIVIASPEYNASVPAVLKNAIDWASRKDGEASRSAFKGKKFALLSASPGRGGGARGLVHLRAIIEDVGGEVVSEQVSVPAAHAAFAEDKLPELVSQLEIEIKSLTSKG